MKTFGWFEKVLLALAGGCVFMLVATTVTPGMQTIVADIACPSWATDAAVVRYPHVERPPEMVRNTPLVCVAGERAELASHARVLPALVAVGVALSGAAVIAASVVRGTFSRFRSATESPVFGGATLGPKPPTPRTATDTIRFLPLMISIPFVFLTVYGAYWWLSVDAPYRVTSCRSSSGGTATCYDGEPVYRQLTFLFGALAVAGVVTWIVLVVKGIRRHRRFDRVWTNGVRTTATLVDIAPTGMKVMGSRLHKFTYEVDPADGAPSFRFVERGTASPAGSEGGSVPVVYDPSDTSAAYTLPEHQPQ